MSLTTTVNTYWGSAVQTTDGIILNNEVRRAVSVVAPIVRAADNLLPTPLT